MRNRQPLLGLSIIIVLGALLRLWFVWKYPLWLDEQYSILFAYMDSPLRLLVNGRDSHPGLFYLLLKGGMSITTSVEALRVLLAVVPQLVGVGVLIAWMRRNAYTQVTMGVATSLLLLNPFFIVLGFQLRMYSLAILVSVVAYIAFTNWQKETTTKNLLILISALVVGNASLYAFLFLTIGVILYLLWKALSQKKLPTLPAALGVGTLLEFLLLNGVGVKSKYEQASSWIPLPSLQNIPSAFWTVMGFEDNYFLVNKALRVGDLIFYAGVFFTCFTLYKKRQQFVRIFTSQFLQRLSFLFVLPVGLIFLASIAMSLLSQRFFFYQFVPKLSLFLPRTFTPFAVIGTILFAEWVGQKKIKNPFIFAFLSLAVLLGWSGTLRSVMNEAQEKEHVFQVSQILTEESAKQREAGFSSYYLPSWIALSTINTEKSEQIEAIEGQMRLSDEFFTKLENGELKSCEQLGASHISYRNIELADAARPYYEKHFAYFDRCCVQDKVTEDFKVWSCGTTKP